MAKVELHKDGPASFTMHGYTVTKGEPRNDIPVEIVRAMKDAHEHIRATFDPADQEQIAEDEASGKAKRPLDQRKRLQLIIGAIDKLDDDDKTHWTTNGKPDARILTSILGWQVTADDRDRAMEQAAKGLEGLEPSEDGAAPTRTPSNITIVKKSEPLLDTGAAAADGNDEDGAVEV